MFLSSLKCLSLKKGSRSGIEMKSLGDGVPFWGDRCTFCTSALALPGCKGNCILICVNISNTSAEEDPAKNIHVFDLDSGSIQPLENYPYYSKLFWPPPAWFTL